MSKINIGLRQAARLSQMPYAKRLDFIAEGLPIIFKSAQGFLQASNSVKERTREFDVLRGYAEEEAAKALILFDVIRCPPKLVSSKIGKMVNWFYDHLARLIYADACHWKPMHVSQLQEYIDLHRKAHYVDGEYGEYIFPNDALFSRESKLYADIGAHEDNELFWNAPTGFPHTLFFDPAAYRVVEALEAVGAFSAGVRVAAEIWNEEEFRDSQNVGDSHRLTEKMLERLIEKKMPHEYASEKHVDAVYEWQFPMYNLELKLLNVSMAELNDQRDALYPYEG